MPARPVRRPLVLASVMAMMFMIAVEATIVSTAMPQIAGQMGDLHLYAWVFSAFLLTQTATTVVFGKLADLYGRRPVLLFGIAVFLLGSTLCGFAASMPALIAYRLIQGVGAGAIQPIGMTVVGDLYTVEERARIQGWLASVWGISSVVGPLAGGLIIQHASWSWIFWINLPIGVIAAGGFLAFMREDVRVGRRSVDVAGAALFTLAIASFMILLTELGTGQGRLAIGAGIVAAAGLVAFVWQERRAKEPMMDFRLWARRPIATANAATLFSGMALVGLTTFLPMYVQGVLNRSPLVAGFTLTVMVLGWPIGATLAARNFQRFGLRSTLLFGSALLPLGAVPFVLLEPGSSPWLAGAGSAVMGLGMGFLSTSSIVLIQDCVGWGERASATASNMFSRSLGSTVGATVLGAVLNLGLAGAGAGTAVDFNEVRRLLDSGGALPGDGAIRAVLGAAIHNTFLSVFALSLLTLLLATLVPRIVARSGPRELAAE